MSLFDNTNTIKLLSNLLNSPKESSDSEEEHSASNNLSKLGPGDILPKRQIQTYDNTTNQEKPLSTTANIANFPKSIQEWEELQMKSDSEALDKRTRPEYRVSYKQDIKTEDLFLQMSKKSTATSSCDEMIIKILMPHETVSIDGMTLSVSTDDIDLQTPIYRLQLPLMQPINPDLGKASWDNEKQILTLRLKMVRELDYVNF